MAPADWAVEGHTSNTFGRVLVTARSHHLVVDGPVGNGCPGEAITPAELFLGGVAACAVELVQVLARDGGTALEDVSAEVSGTIDRGHAVRSDVTLFSEVTLRFLFRGVNDDQASELVESFKGR